MNRTTAQRKCRRKVKHATRGTASNAARASAERFGVLLVPYRCAVCGSWHIGNSPLGIKERSR